MTGTSPKKPGARFARDSGSCRFPRWRREGNGVPDHVVAVVLSLACLLVACSRPAPERIVLVTIDTLRADHVGCYGSTAARTATLDGLARDGVRFETALSPVPLTLPAHTSLMTALDPPHHGVRHNSIFSLGPEHLTLAERMKASGRATAAFMGSLVLHSRFGLSRGFDVYDEQMGGHRSGWVGFAERKADQVVDAALAWLSGAPEKFFLWVHFYDPHATYEPPPAYALSFASAPYDGEIAFTDAQLGRLLRAIDERFGPDGTLVVVTADHGESLGEHGEASHSYSLYDATQRIPLLMKGAGLPAGRSVAAPVRLVDVAPTLLELAGLSALPGVDGRDLLPVLDGDEREPRVAYMETLATQLDLGWSPLFALRDQRSKYIRAPRPELYDVLTDPKELENRASAEPQTVASLDAALGQRLEGAVPVASTVTLSAAERARLESLGYVVPGAEGVHRAAAGVAGRDPKDGMATLATMDRAATLIQKDRGAEALSLLLPLEDGGAYLFSLRAAAALTVGRAADAERDARAALAEGGQRDDVLNLLGGALLLQGKTGEARDAYERSHRAAPESPRPVVGLGRVAEAEGKSDEAIARLRDAYSLERASEASPEAGWLLAALLLETGKTEEADALLAGQPAAALAPEEPARRLAVAELVAGRTDAAVSRLRRALDAHPGSPALLATLGSVLERAGRLEESVAPRERALALAPGAPAALNDLAWALGRSGKDLDRALELAAQARLAAPRAAEVVDTEAMIRLRRREPARALVVLDEAARENVPKLPVLELRRAEALAALGRSDEARRALALAVPPTRGPTPEWEDEAASLAKRLGIAWPPARH